MVVLKLESAVFLTLLMGVIFGKVTIELRLRNVTELNDYLNNVEVVWNGAEMVSFRVQLTETQLIDRSVDLTRLATRLDLSYVNIEFTMLRGFVVGPQSSPFKLVPANFTYSNPHADLGFEDSAFRLFDRNHRPLGASCADYVASYFGLSKEEFAAVADKRALLGRLQGLFSADQPALPLSKLLYPSAGLCPLVFKDCHIYQLGISQNVQSNFIRRESLEFADLSEVLVWAPDFDLNCEVERLCAMGAYRTPLDRLIRLVFVKQIRTLLIRGTFLPMENPDMLRTLPRLADLEMCVDNLRELLHASDNRWLATLNDGTSVDPAVWCSNNAAQIERLSGAVFSLSLYDSQGLYANHATDEDFCLFRHLSPWQAVFVVSALEPHGSCLYWHLALNYQCNRHQNSSWMAATAERCNFTRRLQMCANFSEVEAREMTFYDWIYVAEFAEFVGPVITFPIVSGVGFLLNLIVILVLRDRENKTRHLKKARIYSYLLLNSTFNSIECLISALTLVNECLGMNSAYCSSIQSEYSVQIFKVVVVQYVGEVMKTCSILTLLAFSFERYIQTASSEHNLAKKFKQMNLKWFTICVLVFSFLSSICKLFEYSVNSLAISSQEVPSINIFQVIDKWWFAAAFVAHYALNDGLLLLANLFVDVALVVEIRRDLNKRARFGADAGKNRADKQKEKETTESKTNKMIVYQLVLYLICRLPELVFYMHFFFNPDREFTFYMQYCMDFAFCYLAANLVQYVYMLSYSVNVYFLFQFNKQFRNAFKDYISPRRHFLCLKRQLMNDNQ